MLRWVKHYFTELGKPDGWSLAAKTVAGALALVAGITTVSSYRHATSVDEANAISARMNEIQNGLLSDRSMSRIAALRALQSFASDPLIASVSHRNVRNAAFAFPRRAVLQAIEASKDASPVVVQPVPATASPAERYELLITLNRIGNLGWNQAHKPPFTNRLGYDLDFDWLSAIAMTESSPSTSNLIAAFIGFNFSDIRLNKTNFACLVLSDSSFKNTELKQLSFDNAKLDNASFNQSRLEFVTFPYASMRGTTFQAAELIGVEFLALGDTRLGNTPCAAHPSAELRASRTSLVGASFKESSIVDSDFSNTTLAAAVFDSAVLSADRFGDAQMNGARFVSAHIASAEFKSALLDGTSFAMASLSQTDFSDADLRNSSFQNAQFNDAMSVQSLLSARVLAGSNFSGARGISPVEICGLLKVGAVLVANEEEWSSAGRRPETANDFMSVADRKTMAECDK